MFPALAHFPIDPAYGTGTYRRRLRFTPVDGGVVAQVDDTHHSYWLTIDHNGSQVIAVDAGFSRAPTNMCPGSIAGLAALVGARVGARADELLARLPRESNCTHLADLAVWTLAQTDRPALWEVEIPDQADAPVWIAIARDGVQMLRWRIDGFSMVEPIGLAGRPLMGGFMRWASATYSDDELLAATMLQRGLFVARGRQHIVDRSGPMPLARAAGMAGMCWAYSGERLEAGVGSLAYVRDFTRGVEPEPPAPQVAARLKEPER